MNRWVLWFAGLFFLELLKSPVTKIDFAFAVMALVLAVINYEVKHD